MSENKEETIRGNVGNKVKLKSGEVGEIIKLQGGNFLVVLNTRKNKWVSPSDIEEVING